MNIKMKEKPSIGSRTINADSYGTSVSQISEGDAQREAERSNPLIKQLHDAVRDGIVPNRFTVQHVRDWMREYDIRKGDGRRYFPKYVATLLSDSLIKKKKTKNRNSKWLRRQLNDDGDYQYWFDE